MKIKSTCLSWFFTLITLMLGQHWSTAQISMSSGSYSQDFNTLATSGGPPSTWTDNSTLPGWYASRQNGGTFTAYSTTNGSSNAGQLYSFGVNGDSDRALGSVSSGTPNTIGYGLRLQNDTAFAQTNITISYTGEQWRNGGNSSQATQPLTFYYRIDNTPITSPEPAVSNTWTAVSALTFISPTTNNAAVALNGNDSTNRQIFSNIVLSGVLVNPGQEIFLRWLDINDTGNDHGLAVDDFSVSYTQTAPVYAAPAILVNPTNVTIAEGGSPTFTVSTSGSPLPTYQWYLVQGGTSNSISGAVGSSFTTNYLPLSFSGSGFYVIANNSQGSATSTVATVTITNAPVVATNIAYFHTLQNANYVLTNGTTLFQATGVVTTTGDLVTGSPANSFFIQDATGGIDVFYREGAAVPNAGDLVRITAPLGQFSGLLELSPTNANPAHKIEILSSGNPLPTPSYFDLATVTNIAAMERTNEGRFVIVSNVYLTLTNANGIMVAGGPIFMTNLNGVAFTLLVPDNIASDPAGYPLPGAPASPPFTMFASSVKGVISQSDGTPTPTNGYRMYLSLRSDIEIGTPPATSVSLSVRFVSGTVEISWPTSAGGTLEATASLSPTSWSSAGLPAPTTSGTNNVVTITSPTGKQFYRLHL